MNYVNLEEIENKKQQFLKEHGVDEKSITKFKKKIKKVSALESEELGKKLYELISKNYDDNNDIDMAIELVCKGANVEFQEESKGNFPLLVCARKGYLKTFILLLRAGADVNQLNKYHTTATMACARHGYQEMLQTLIYMGADINIQCLDGDNALMSAKKHNQLECFQMLSDAGAYLNVRNLGNKTLLDIESDSNSAFELTKISNGLKLQQCSEPAKKITSDDISDVLKEAEQKLIKIRNK